MEAEKIVYTCRKGILNEFLKHPDTPYKKAYNNLIVYHSEKCPNGYMPECLNCEFAELGLSFGLIEGKSETEPETEDKAQLVKFCRIWQPKKKK